MSREARALEVLKDGGYFRKQLESAFHGGEKFKTRLRDRQGRVVPGIGEVTFLNLRSAGQLKWRETSSSSVFPEEYVLAAK